MESIFKEGQTVWCLIYGKGKVEQVDYYFTTYPVGVVFDNEKEGSYTKDGRFDLSSARTLFFSEPKVEALTEAPFEPELKSKRALLRFVTRPIVVEAIIHDETKDTITYSTVCSNVQHTIQKSIVTYTEVEEDTFKTFKG